MNRKEVATGFAWNFIFGLPHRILLPIIGILIARVLGPSELGVYAVLTSVLAMADTVRDAGLSHTYVADPESEEQTRERAYATFAVLTSLVLASVIFFTRFAIADFFNFPQLPWGLSIVALTLVLNGLQTISGAKLNKQAKFKEIGIALTIATFVSYALALALAYMGYGFQALVWQMLLRAVLQLILVYRVAPVSMGALSLDFLRSMFGKLMSNLAQNLMYSIYTILDNALIAKLFGKAGIGYYANAWSLGIKPIEFVSFPLSGALFVAYTRFSGDKAKFASAYCRSLAAAALGSLPLFVFIALFAREIILVLYTPKFASSIPLLTLLAVYFAFRSLGTLAGSAMVAAGKSGWNVLSWTAGYAVALTGLFLSWGPASHAVEIGPAGGTVTTIWGTLTLWKTVAWITAGAITAYSLMIVSSLTYLKPLKSDLSRISKAIAAAIPALVVGLWLRQAPLDDVWLLIVAGFGVLAAQVVSIGLLYTGRLTGAATPSGLKEIWRSL